MGDLEADKGLAGAWYAGQDHQPTGLRCCGLVSDRRDPIQCGRGSRCRSADTTQRAALKQLARGFNNRRQWCVGLRREKASKSIG